MFNCGLIKNSYALPSGIVPLFDLLLDLELSTLDKCFAILLDG